MAGSEVEIIGVIDVREGGAVHAVAGQRDRYAPVAAVAGVRVEGDAAALARAYVEHLGLRELYVADLDAIVGGRPPTCTLPGIAAPGTRTWVDAGVRSAAMARDLLGRGAAQVIVALETLPSWAALADIVDAIGSDRVGFSVDLRDGVPLRPARTDVADEPPERLASRAAALGVASVLVIDLARVGIGAGLDLDLLRRVHAAAPGVRLVAGGGVRELRDVEDLAAAGCDAVLVATALHDGRIGAADVAAARAWAHRSVSR